MNFMQRALDFLKNHVEIAFATSESNRLHIHIFQIMKMEGSTLFFATSTLSVFGMYRPYISSFSSL